MTVSDPDQPDRRTGGPRPGETDPSDDTATDTTFDEIVAAGWSTQPDVPRWPAEHAAADTTEDAPEPVPGRVAPAHDDHYVPPEPPPLPVLRPRTVGGLVVLAVGVVLLLAPGVIGLAGNMSMPLGLLLLTGGFGWLALGLRTDPPPDSGWDDGAQL